MSGYVLAAEAERDLEEILAYVAADKVRAARQLLDDLDAAMLRLGEMPRMGCVRRALAKDDVRFWIVHSYVIVYRTEVSPIEVLRIVSGYRDLVETLS